MTHHGRHTRAEGALAGQARAARACYQSGSTDRGLGRLRSEDQEPQRGNGAGRSLRLAGAPFFTGATMDPLPHLRFCNRSVELRLARIGRLFFDAAVVAALLFLIATR